MLYSIFYIILLSTFCRTVLLKFNFQFNKKLDKEKKIESIQTFLFLILFFFIKIY